MFYGSQDVVCYRNLPKGLLEVMNITPNTREAYQLLHDGSLALARAERNGMRIDVQYCEQMGAHLIRQIQHLEKKLRSSELMTYWRRQYGSSFNMDSGDQLSDILYSPEHFNLTPSNYTDGKCKRCKGKGCEFCRGEGRNPSVDVEALETVELAEIKDLVRIRALSKAQDTYLMNFMREQVEGVIHTNFNLHLARSYRPSTDSPNLANVPVRNPEIKKIVRRAVKARPGHKIVCADFKGIEVAVGCPYHHDKNMIKYVSDKSTDMHRDAAKDCFLLGDKMWDWLVQQDKANHTKYAKEIRQTIKGGFVFSQFYGDWWKSCAGSMWTSSMSLLVDENETLNQYLATQGIKNLQAFEEHIKKCEDILWNERHPGYTKWKKDWVAEYQEKGYFDMLTGFRCGGVVMDRKQACNYPIQGSAFHLMLQCIIWMDEDSRKEGWQSFIVNQIYDDLMMDVYPSEEQMIVDRMRLYMTERLPERFPWINVPLEVEVEACPIDGTWYDKSEEWVEAK